MTKEDAALELIFQEKLEKFSFTSYKRILKACKILKIDKTEILKQLEYFDCNGNPFTWLQNKIIQEGERKK